MPSKKKLQVFVSSTYIDLREERQAAVEAILTAGHIPAGMELFTSGDQTQMQVIKRWIDESDVFLLILGGRYGSLEPTSNKSYVELEYQYADEKRKPCFAVVIAEEHIEQRVREHGTRVIEMDSPQQLRDFRRTVLSRMSKFWREPKDIKLAIYEYLLNLSTRDELIGWIPGDQGMNAPAIADQITRLTKENALLRERLSQQTEPTGSFTGLTYDEMFSLLRQEKIDASTDLLETIWNNQDQLQKGAGHNHPLTPHFEKLSKYGLVTLHPTAGYALTDDGKRFLLRTRVPRSGDDALVLALGA